MTEALGVIAEALEVICLALGRTWITDFEITG
jgi:hypothetical protein